MTDYKDEKRELGFPTSDTRTGEASQNKGRNEVFARSARLKPGSATSRRRYRGRHRWNFFLACDCSIYPKDNAPRVRETTLEQKRYYIEQILKPYFEGILIGDIGARAVIYWENYLLESRTKRDTPYTATYLNTLCSQLSAIMNHLVRFCSLERNLVWIAGKVGSKERREMNARTREQYL